MFMKQWAISKEQWSPRIDGDFVPDEPIRLMKKGHFNKVDLLQSISRNEGTIFALGSYVSDNKSVHSIINI